MLAKFGIQINCNTKVGTIAYCEITTNTRFNNDLPSILDTRQYYVPSEIGDEGQFLISTGNGSNPITYRDVKTLDTTATSAQSTNDSEALIGSGKITLHKVSKTGNYNDLLNKPTIDNNNQTVKGNGTAFGANAVVNIVGGGATSVTANTTNNKITISSSDTGATSIETAGTGNAVSSASYDASTRKITLTKGVTALTSHQSIKTLKTDNTDAQTASSSEAISGSGTINLHKIAKTGTYGDLIGTPIPGDSGEIKTKYRCALKGYTGSGNPVWYYKLVKLPTDNSGNYASAIINGRIGGWTAGGMSSIYCLIWNRDGVGLALLDIGGTGTMSSIFDTADLVVYKNSDNTADIYIRCKGYFTFDLDVEVYQSTATITYDGTYITTTPSGTESGKASTSTSRLELEKGVLKVNGTAVQSKISELGSATKPVYFSSDGVASTCSTYAGGTAVTLNGTSKAASTASFYAPTSVGTNGQLLSSNGSSLVWTDDNRSLLHHDLGVIIENTTTDNGWSMFNSTYNGFLLKSVRFNANSPSWGVGDFGAGIVFGGGDTKGVVSVAYRTPDIKIAGGNGDKPVWWIGLTGTSAKSYDLDRLNYTPTTAGTSGHSLKSNGSGAPRWSNSRSVAISGTVSTGAKTCVAASAMITNSGTDNELGKGLWYYVGTYGVFIVFVPTAITTPYSAKTIYITGYVSNQMSGNITLVEL